jgi:hypothetical protein
LKRLDPIARNSFAGGLEAESVEVFIGITLKFAKRLKVKGGRLYRINYRQVLRKVFGVVRLQFEGFGANCYYRYQ